jgi:glycerol 2-dehydrogenase (NADP+)
MLSKPLCVQATVTDPLCPSIFIQLNPSPGHIDTARAYGNEAEVGAGIHASGIPRSEIWLTTKLDNPSHKNVSERLDQSLRLLGVDYVDLYLMHWPVSVDPATGPSPATPGIPDPRKVYADWDFVDTWIAMQALPATGKVRNIGVSNFGIRQLEKLLSDPRTTIVPAVNQIELHPSNPSPKLVDYCRSRGIHNTGYSCLGSTDSPLYSDAMLLSLAQKLGKTPQQVMLLWGLQKGWSVIPKSVSEERIKGNFDIDGLELSEEDIKTIDGIKDRFKVCQHESLPPGVKVFFGDDE